MLSIINTSILSGVLTNMLDRNRQNLIQSVISSRKLTDSESLLSSYSEAPMAYDNSVYESAELMIESNSEACPVKDLSECPVLKVYPDIACNKCNKELRDRVCEEINKTRPINPRKLSINKPDPSQVDVTEIMANSTPSFSSNTNSYALNNNPYIVMSANGVIDTLPNVDAATNRANDLMLQDPSLMSVWIYKPIRRIDRTTTVVEI